MGQIDEDARNRRKAQQLAAMAMASKPLFSVNVDDAGGKQSMTATRIKDMHDAHKLTFPAIAPKLTEAWEKALLDKYIKDGPGAIQSMPPPAKDGKVGGPRVQSELIEEEVPLVPIPDDAFAIHVAVTAQLSAKDLYMSKMAKQIADAVHHQRSHENMSARDLLNVYIQYDDLGVRVKVTTNASLSKAIVEVADITHTELGATIFKESMTYDQFEAYQSPVPDAGNR